MVAVITMLLDGSTRKHQIQLKIESICCSVQVLLPEVEFKKILYNLTRNAIQASPNGETVTIRFECTSDEAEVSVADRGTGIADDILPQNFDSFFTTKARELKSGMGLGLSVS